MMSKLKGVYMAFKFKKPSVSGLKGNPKKILSGVKKTFSFKKKQDKTSEKGLRFNYKNPKVIVISLVSALVLFLTVMGVGIYAFAWEDGFTKAVSIFPYPAAYVNGRFVTYRDYLEQLDVIKNYDREFKKVDFTTEDGKKVLEQARKDTMNRLIEDAIVAKEAVRLDVKLTGKELTDKFNQLVESNGGLTSFANVLKQYYKLTPNEFKEEIYRPRLLRQMLADKYSSDEDVNADSKQKAEEILEKIKAGGDFAEIAKQYSQDSSASVGGDLGYFSKGKMVPEFEKVAFGLKKGETSDVVKTVYGYHIIRVTDVKGDEIRASHILIKTKDFDTWLADSVKEAKTTIFIKQ
jgi:foldase protein PrsA